MEPMDKDTLMADEEHKRRKGVGSRDRGGSLYHGEFR